MKFTTTQVNNATLEHFCTVKVVSRSALLQNVFSMAATIATPSRAPASKKPLFVLLFAGFVLLGIPTVIIGPILPVFISRWALSDSQAGIFFTVEFTASLAGVWVATWLAAKRGYRPPLFLGYLLTAIGLALLNASSEGVALLATAAFGLGYGCAVPPTNLSAAEAGGERSAGLISFLNFAWGIGAVACSPLILLALRHHFLSSLLSTIAGTSLLIAVGFLFVAFPADKHAAADNSSSAPAILPGLAVTISIAALFFIYVGTETSIGGWAAEHAKRLAGHATNLSTIAPMFFYGGLTTGRALTPLVLLRVRERKLIFTALALVSIGVGIVIAARSQPIAIAGLIVGGFGCSSIYPIYIAWFSRWYGAAARRLGGVTFSVASLGGSVVPWLVGFVSQHAGSLRIGLLIPLFCAALMFAILLSLRRRVST